MFFGDWSPEAAGEASVRSGADPVFVLRDRSRPSADKVTLSWDFSDVLLSWAGTRVIGWAGSDRNRAPVLSLWSVDARETVSRGVNIAAVNMMEYFS